MILSMSGQMWLFLSTVAAGFVIGLLYDIFRIMRKTVRHSGWAVQLEDILFWLCTTVIMFYFMLHRNYGEIRFFSIVGSSLGMILYFNSLSIFVVKACVSVIQFLKNAVSAIVRVILIPVRLSIKILTPLLRVFKRLLRYIRTLIYNNLRAAKRSVFLILKKV